MVIPAQRILLTDIVLHQELTPWNYEGWTG